MCVVPKRQLFMITHTFPKAMKMLHALHCLVIAIGSRCRVALNFTDGCNMFFVFALSVAQQDKIRNKLSLPTARAKSSATSCCSDCCCIFVRAQVLQTEHLLIVLCTNWLLCCTDMNTISQFADKLSSSVHHYTHKWALARVHVNACSA